MLATIADYVVMTLCVRDGGIRPAVATACGAFVGTIVGFLFARRWVFRAVSGSAATQAMRYFAVSLVSLLMNAGGEGALVHAGMHYLAARPVVSLVVSLGWNLPMQSWFVFGSARREREDVRA